MSWFITVLTLLGVPREFHEHIQERSREGLQGVLLFGFAINFQFVNKALEISRRVFKPDFVYFHFTYYSFLTSWEHVSVLVNDQYHITEVCGSHSRWFFDDRGRFLTATNGDKVLHRKSLLYLLFQWRKNRSFRRQFLEKKVHRDLASIVWQYL